MHHLIVHVTDSAPKKEKKKRKETVANREEVVERLWCQKCHAGRKSLHSGSLPERNIERGMRQGSSLRPAEGGKHCKGQKPVCRTERDRIVNVYQIHQGKVML